MTTKALAAPPATARLGAHHVAHLAAVVEGMSIEDAAKRYLGVHASSAAKQHRQIVELVRALARRRDDARWDVLPLDDRADANTQEDATPEPPSLQEWAEARGYDDGWREEELLEMYQAEHGAVGNAAEASTRGRQQRAERLRRERRAFLADVQRYDLAPAAPSDLVEGWFPAHAAQLRALGVLTLDDLQRRIARGGRWWAGLRAVGPIKAQRMADLVATVLTDARASGWPAQLAAAELERLSGRDGANRVRGRRALTEAHDDRSAMRAWIVARAGSQHTASQYEREVERAMLWAVLERRKALSDLTAEDCRAYLDFLAEIPDRWISRRRAARFAPGWAPFRGQLTLASQRVAADVVSSFFAWAVRADYIEKDPWVLVNRRLGDDPLAEDDDDPTSRALTPEGWAALIAHLEGAPATPSVERLRWLCVFLRAVGLRANELVRATRAHFGETADGPSLRVHGKGRRNRVVPVPRVAMEATRRYFQTRGLEFETAPADTPLLASLDDPSKGVSYRSLVETITRLMARVARDSKVSLSQRERARLARASTHWLRHTYATRLAEEAVAVDVLQELLGQADPRTTSKYYRAQHQRKRREVDRVFK